MAQDQALRVWPAATASAVSLTIYFRSRQTEGTGSYVGGSPAPADLVILFPTGRDVMATHAAIREAIIQHALNTSTLLAWWSPESATPEAALRAALGDLHVLSVAASTGLYVFFDGQFGSVFAG